ncbi:MAG: DHA2 family efflux MFS transporter permease subunit [Rickettsiaceae bacterium]|nr:MAG: DHA2 family efflux MFS transporter permease subunit [Rickettsiaceae bacterium]
MTKTSEAETKLSKTQLLAFLGMIVGMFMAILDIQIVASSLSVIAAGLSASSDELSWVQTSYLIAEVIIIPLSGYIARVLSTRITYFIAALGFTVMSVLCSLAWNIESMILFRALQGFFGGAMIPTVFSTVFIIFPPSKRPTVTVIMGLVVTIAPTLGPVLGGYITELVSWHFMFLLNVIPGIFVCFVVYMYGHFDSPNLNLLQNFDRVGVILMVIMLSSLQYVLEEGNKKGWLDDTLIIFLVILIILSFVGLLIWELVFINPVLDLRAFNNRNFTFGCIYSFIIGMGMYGAVYLLPLFLFSIAGFNTVQIGMTMMVTGIAQFISAPIAGRLFGMGMDLRIMLTIGMSLFSLGCYTNSFLTPDSRLLDFLVPQIIRGMSLMFCFIPTNNVALSTMPKHKIHSASGLFNLTRNLGGAIGLAAISTTVANKTKVFSQYIGENLSITSYFGAQQIENLSRAMYGKVLDPQQGAYQMISNSINRDAFVIAINDVFITISIIFLCGMILIPFTSNIKNSSDEHAH